MIVIQNAAAPAPTPDTSPFDLLKNTVLGMFQDLVAAVPRIVIALLVFMAFALAARGVRSLLRRAFGHTGKQNVGAVLGRLGYFATLLLGALVAITVVVPSMTPGRLVSLLGIGGVAIGFAFKDIFQNMLAGILLLWRQPFRIGDEITTRTFTGVVEDIETRATMLKTYDGRRILIPNSIIYAEPVSVITAFDVLRTEYDVGIGYGDDVAKAKALLLDILKSAEGVLAEPAPDVLTWDLAGSTVNLRVRFWTKPHRGEVLTVRDRVLQAIRDRLPAEGIDLPYPTQVILLHDQTEETDGDRTRQREGWPPGKAPPAQRISARHAAPSDARR
jgi:small conductance mechanosensitive channel